MKKFVFLFGFVALLNWGNAGFADFLPAGTPVQVGVDQALDADLVKVGMPVKAHLLLPVKREGRVVLPAGTPVIGMVTRRKNNNIAGIQGYLELGNFKITTPEGASLPLSGTIYREGNSRMAGSLIGGYLILLPIFIKGQDGKVEAGAQSTLFTMEEYEYQ
jgi:hypothetical protein